MRFGACLLLFALLATPGCRDDDSDNVSWTATFTGSEGTTTSAGGAVIQVEKKAILGLPVWVMEEPKPFRGDVPIPDLGALADALARTDWEVLDAVLTPLGTVALLDSGPQNLLMLLEDGPDSSLVVPESALRLLPAGEDPLRVLVLLSDDEAALATRVVP